MLPCQGRQSAKDVMASYQPSTVLGSHLSADSVELYESICRTVGITRLSRLTGLDKAGLPVWSAVRPSSMTWQTSAGKGMTDQQAIVSSIMECAETAHTEQFLRLGGQIDAVKFRPDEMMMRNIALESSKYVNSQNNAAMTDGMLGIVAKELKEEVEDIVPMHWGYQSQEAVDYGFSTNGLSCGTSQSTAIVHSLEEVYERHVFSSLCRNAKIDKTCIRALKCELEDCIGPKLIKRLESCRLKPVFLTHNGSPIPFAWCIIFDNDPIAPFLQITSGYSCGRSYREAAARAFTEACQVRCSQIQGTREDFTEKPKDTPTDLVDKFNAFVRSIRPDDCVMDRSSIEQDLYMRLLTQSMPGKIYCIHLKEMIKGCYACKVIAPECKFNTHIF
jgi:YcaO-like protein with predicted kinase domain